MNIKVFDLILNEHISQYRVVLLVATLASEEFRARGALLIADSGYS